MHGNALRRLRRSGRSKAIPEISSFIPVNENRFGLDGAKVEKNSKKNVRPAYGRYLKSEKQRKTVTSSSRRDTMSSWKSTSFSTPQNRAKKKIARHEVRSPNKNHRVWLVFETRDKFYCLTQRHR